MPRNIRTEPIRPGSVVRVVGSPSRSWTKNVGRRFRVGYYSKADGLDCIWLVNDKGEYEQTIDHEFLRRFFVVESYSRERSLYGKNRLPLQPVADLVGSINGLPSDLAARKKGHLRSTSYGQKRPR